MNIEIRQETRSIFDIYEFLDVNQDGNFIPIGFGAYGKVFKVRNVEAEINEPNKSSLRALKQIPIYDDDKYNFETAQREIGLIQRLQCTSNVRNTNLENTFTDCAIVLLYDYFTIDNTDIPAGPSNEE